MKKIIPILLGLVLYTSISQAQFVTIPDVALRNLLKGQFPLAFNNADQMDTTNGSIVNATQLSLAVINFNIVDVTGVQYFKHLVSLDLSFNNITHLPPNLSSTIKNFTCNGNLQPSEFSKLPHNLSYISFDYSSITELTNLPNSVTTIYAQESSLTTISNLPDSLKNLYCLNSDLQTFATALPGKLELLDVAGCVSLTHLPAVLPTSLKYLHFAYSGVHCLPTLPNSLIYLDVITDYPGTQISCLPNIPPNLITTLPICSASTDVYQCNFTYTGSLPGIPGAISGPIDGCAYTLPTSSAGYSINEVSNATGYMWTVPPGATILTAPNSNGLYPATIRMRFPTGFDGSGSNDLISVAAVNPTGTGPARSLTILCGPLPAPAELNGPTQLCIGSAGADATYSCKPINSATGYSWSVPVGALITSHPAGTGVNDTIINVHFSTASIGYRTISVRAVIGNILCTVKRVRVNCLSSVLGNAGVFLGNPLNADPTKPVTDLCLLEGNGSSNVNGTPVEYKIRKVTNATSYIWSVTNANANAGIVSVSHPAGTGINDTVIVVLFDISLPKTIYTYVKVQAANECHPTGTTARSLSIKPLMSATPGAISGIADICTAVAQGTNNTYTIRKVNLATGYIWSFNGAGAPFTTITHPNGAGENDTIIIVHFSPGYTATVLNVASARNCGSSIVRAIILGVKKIVAPASISGVANPCPLTDQTYTCRRVANASSYLWTVPLNATFTTLADTAIVVHYPSSLLFKAGNVSVQALSVCGGSAAKALSITKGLTCRSDSKLSSIPVNAEIATDIDIYPNPSVGDFNIRLSGANMKETVAITITNLYGQIVYSNEIKANNNILNVKNSFPNGYYVVACRIGSKTITKKMLVNR